MRLAWTGRLEAWLTSGNHERTKGDGTGESIMLLVICRIKARKCKLNV